MSSFRNSISTMKRGTKGQAGDSTARTTATRAAKEAAGAETASAG